jgi:hypothetical protein
MAYLIALAKAQRHSTNRFDHQRDALHTAGAAFMRFVS